MKSIEPTQRLAYIDQFRGLLMAHMALDHVSMMFNLGRPGEEFALRMPALPESIWQFLTRFSGVPVATGFTFIAGYMVATTCAIRSKRGTPDAEVTRRLLIRGLVLILADAVIAGLPRIPMGFFSFAVLSSLGVGLMGVALLRQLPQKVLLGLALAVIFAVSALPLVLDPNPLLAILYNPDRAGAFRSQYPILPWAAVMLLGYVVGRDAQTRERLTRFWGGLALFSLVLFFVIRIPGGYGNAYPHQGVTSMSFWLFSKYPPDLAWLSWSMVWIFGGLAFLRFINRNGAVKAMHPFVVYGRVAFFFYLTHFYVIGPAQAASGLKVGLLGTYGIWILLLLVMLWPCAWYYRKKMNRPNFVTRYI
jgi:uncharacterized membrane protein